MKRARAADLLADARRLLGAQEQDEAQGFLRESLELDPGNRKARRLGRVIRDLQHRRMVQSRLEGWSREAGEAAAARHFSRAVDILKLALRLDGVNLVEKNRLEQMCSRMEQSQRSVQLVAEARQLLDQQDLTEAQSKAAEALARDSQSAEASEMLLVIGEAIKSRDRKVRVEQALTQVKSLLLVQSFDTAISILVSLRAEFNSPLIEQWLAHVEAQRAEAERQTRFQVQLSEAQSMLAQQRFAETMDKLEVLGREFPEKGELSDLLVQTRQAKERASAIAQAMDQCDQFRREERFDKALEVVDVALAACPAEPALQAVRHEVEEQWRHKSALHFARYLTRRNGWSNRIAPILPFIPAGKSRRLFGSTNPCLPAYLDRGDAAGMAETTPRSRGFVPRRRFGGLTPVVRGIDCPRRSIGSLSHIGGIAAGGRAPSQPATGPRTPKKLKRRMEMIEQKITAEAWSQALSLIETSQKEFPGEPELQDLLEESTRGLRRSQCESITAEVRQCLADDDIEQAEVILRTGLQSLGEEPALYTLRDELEAYRKYRDEWRTAQVFFGRRKFQEAERILVRLADQNRPDVETLLKAVREARAASDEDHFYARGREKALKLMQQQQFQQAADLLCNLLALFPGEPILERDLRSAQGGRDQERPGDTVTESKDIGEPELCEPPAEPMCQASPARLLETESAVAAPARLRSAVITAATLLLLVSASAAGVEAFSQRVSCPIACSGLDGRADTYHSQSPEPNGGHRDSSGFERRSWHEKTRSQSRLYGATHSIQPLEATRTRGCPSSRVRYPSLAEHSSDCFRTGRGRFAC